MLQKGRPAIGGIVAKNSLDWNTKIILLKNNICFDYKLVLV